jgi:hypothetical protein
MCGRSTVLLLFFNGRVMEVKISAKVNITVLIDGYQSDILMYCIGRGIR